jgi:hypothetical protein
MAHVYAYAIDHTELDLEETMKEAQAEDPANPELKQGKPRCILPHSLTFLFEPLYLCYAWLYINLYELCWYRSYIMVILPDYPWLRF